MKQEYFSPKPTANGCHHFYPQQALSGVRLPAGAMHWPSAGLVLGQRLRRCVSVGPVILSSYTPLSPITVISASHWQKIHVGDLKARPTLPRTGPTLSRRFRFLTPNSLQCSSVIAGRLQPKFLQQTQGANPVPI